VLVDVPTIRSESGLQEYDIQPANFSTDEEEKYVLPSLKTTLKNIEQSSIVVRSLGVSELSIDALLREELPVQYSEYGLLLEKHDSPIKNQLSKFSYPTKNARSHVLLTPSQAISAQLGPGMVN